MRKLALLALLGIAATCTPTVPKYSIKYAEKRGTLTKNGLRFVIVPDATTQMVQVDVRYDVGSREDPVNKAGLAHVVEHLMFQQRPDGPTTPPLFQSIIDLDTQFNAFTNWDSTHYQNYVRSDLLDAVLKIEAMRMYYRCQTIPEEQFEREREVVRNEIRWRTGDARGQMEQMILGAVYPKGHAYSREIGGNDAQLANISLKDACEFEDKYYTPDRATVVIVGGVDPDKTVELLRKWFENIEQRTPAPRVAVAPLDIPPGQVEFSVDVERPMLHVAWAIPPSNTREGDEIRFGIQQAFFGAAVKAQEYDFATQVLPQYLGGELAPVFVISIRLKSIDKVNEALEFVRNAAQQAHRGFDDMMSTDLEEQKNRSKASFIQGIEPLEARALYIAELVQFSKEVDFNSSEEYIIHELKKIDDYDGAHVRDTVKKWLDPDKAKVIVIKNTKEGVHGDTRASLAFASKSDDQAEQSEVDPREALRPLRVGGELKTLSGATHFTLDNGMHVVLMPVEGMPVVSAQLQFNVGDAADPAVASGAARFLHLPPDAELFARAGVDVGCESDLDQTSCTSSGINIYLDVVLKSLERLITAGEYSQKGLEAYAKQYRESMKLKETQSTFEVTRQRLIALYGEDHPYTRAGALTPDVVDRLGHDKLMSFKNAHYTAGNATLIIAGNFDPKKAEALVRDTFGGWGRGNADAPVPSTLRQRSGAEYIGVVAEDKPQTDIQILYPAPAGVDGQDAARMLLAQIMNSRAEDVRFKLGASYGTYAGHLTRVGPSAYVMGGAVDTARTGESLKALRDGVALLQRVASKTGSDADVKQFLTDFVRGRRKLIQSLLSVSTVSSELSSRLGFIAQYGLPADYYHQLLQRVATVSPAQIEALIQTELVPETEIIVTKGSRATIEKTFGDAGITKVKIVEPEYK